jgi:hypothetical protein
MDRVAFHRQRVDLATPSSPNLARPVAVFYSCLCGETRIAYNSYRNRHCPKCQGLARAQWLADRQAELLPVPYFHLVFTMLSPSTIDAAIAVARVHHGTSAPSPPASLGLPPGSTPIVSNGQRGFVSIRLQRRPATRRTRRLPRRGTSLNPHVFRRKSPGIPG